MTLEPIGIFHSESLHPYEARRQASADTLGTIGEIHLLSGRGFEQALEDLDGFERIWVIYQFHHNNDWKPKVIPPRGSRVKRGVFATRAPYRPNPIGISCVQLVKVEKLKVIIAGHDLLDGTPVLDIKPYLPYADAFPDAKVGWLEVVESERWDVRFSENAMKQIEWLENEGVNQLRGFIQGQLEFAPLDFKRKRVEVKDAGGGEFRLSYRTWRVDFKADLDSHQIQVESIHSGYSKADLADSSDPHNDKDTHRRFNGVWRP